MKELLEESKIQLIQPLGQARRRLLIILNVAFLSLAIYFLCSEKLSTGNAVPHPSLYLIYIPGIILNFLSAVYNYAIFKHIDSKKQISGFFQKLIYHHKSLDQL